MCSHVSDRHNTMKPHASMSPFSRSLRVAVTFAPGMNDSMPGWLAQMQPLLDDIEHARLASVTLRQRSLKRLCGNFTPYKRSGYFRHAGPQRDA